MCVAGNEPYVITYINMDGTLIILKFVLLLLRQYFYGLTAGFTCHYLLDHLFEKIMLNKNNYLREKITDQ
jgi:hypothetical protein